MLTFLRLVRNHVDADKGNDDRGPYSKEKSFMSRQTFEHMLISCQAALLRLRLARELNVEVHL